MKGFEIQSDKLLEDFLTMVQIDSPSRNERGMADWLTEQFRALGCEVVEDDAGKAVDGNAGNLKVKLKGNTDGVGALLFSSHMDTVEPANGIEPVVEDGIVRSKGETVLGADDKAGLAVILHLARMAQAQPDVPRPDLEFSIHICEEVGLLGAKHLDASDYKAIAGFILDDHDPRGVTIKSPTALRMEIKVTGRPSHAGMEPEKGISALQVAAEAITRIKMGRIDDETTTNIGTIEGGRATNIITETVKMKAEARSHSKEKLEEQYRHITGAFEEVCKEWRERRGEDELPKVEFDRKDDYPAVQMSPEDYPVKLAVASGKSLGWELELKSSGGGTDGSVLNGKGVPCIVLGVGMEDVHSTKEWIKISDMEEAAQLCSTILTTHAAGEVQ